MFVDLFVFVLVLAGSRKADIKIGLTNKNKATTKYTILVDDVHIT